MTDMPQAPKTLTSQQACEALGIQPATLYAYVSRGLIRSFEQTETRSKGYSAEDIAKLKAKKSLRQAPESGAMGSLDWGLPVLASSVSTIVDGQLKYRGQPLESLLKLSIEELVRLLWQQPDWEPPAKVAQAGELALQGLGSFERLQLMNLWYGTRDLGAFDLSRAGALASSGRILTHFFAEVSGRSSSEQAGLLGYFAELDAPRQNLLRIVLIVCADHELNSSTFTARCVASARSSPYAAVTAALAALEGLRHGGSTRETESLFQLCEQSPSVSIGLRRWLQQGKPLPGCGHRLYPDGDPRWQIVKRLLDRDFGGHPALQLTEQVLTGFAELDLPPPNLDFALATAGRVIAWPETEPLVWFALGRVIGWLAHIQEQYGQELHIRPRARIG